MKPQRRPDVLIGVPTTGRNGTASRVTTRVDGMDIWFESDELDLMPSPEAIVAAFLIPSMAAGRRLVSEAPLSADFVDHLPTIMRLVSRWWRYPILPPVISTRDSAPPARDLNSVALCFSGGVDSFHSLLKGPRKPGLLVLAHGFDVKLEDSERAGQMLAMAKTVAAESGARAALVRTNLRHHPLFKASAWGRTHGGALGGLGHLLPDAGLLVISSSYSRRQNISWGSHPDLDPLWSGAGLAIEHFGEEYLRADKIAAIGHEPLVRKHLRVCWRHPNALPNCSRCTKCVRTRMLLSAFGALDGHELLEGNDTLAASIDAMPLTGHAKTMHQFHSALAGQLPPDVRAAVERFLSRSRGAVLLERLHLLDLAQRVVRKARHIGGLVGRGSGVPAEP